MMFFMTKPSRYIQMKYQSKTRGDVMIEIRSKGVASIEGHIIQKSTHTHTLISARAIRRKDCRTRKTRGGLQRCKGFHISSLANEVMVTFVDGRH